MKGGIPRLAPPTLARRLQSLPPILDNVHRTPTSSCSKGSRGLSVQPRVLGIFTETTVSPDPSKRQRPSRYAIRAGRNFVLLPRFRGHRLSLHLDVAWRARSCRARTTHERNSRLLGQGPASDRIHRLSRLCRTEYDLMSKKDNQSLRGQARRTEPTSHGITHSLLRRP